MTSSGIARLYSGEQRIDALDPRDRGFAYGDGVFETILVHRGEPVWWKPHLERLAIGCRRLGIALPGGEFLRGEVAAVVDRCRRGVLKLVVTRGVGARGYAPQVDLPATLAITLSDPPAPTPHEGVVLRWCETRLAIQPRLAGIKHLNRLEQVLARAEWNDPAIHEGLQCDARDRVVSATSANLFVLRGGAWCTPPVAECGIAGVCRSWLLDRTQGREIALGREDVESADALVLCNSVRGILPVVALGERRWPAGHPSVVEWMRRLRESEPAFDFSETRSSPEEA